MYKKTTYKWLFLMLFLFIGISIPIGSKLIAHYSKSDEVVKASNEMQLKLEDEEVEVNQPFILTLQDFGATPAVMPTTTSSVPEDSDETLNQEMSGVDSLLPGNEKNWISSTKITLPLGVEYDEAGTMLRNANQVATIVWDQNSRTLEIDWLGNQANTIEISLVAKGIGDYRLTAGKEVNGSKIEADPISFSAVAISENIQDVSEDEVSSDTETEESTQSENKNMSSMQRADTKVAAMAIDTSDPSIAVVTNAVELRAAILDLNITQIYFGANIELNVTAQIPNGKKYLRISGKNPVTGEIHTMTENSGIGGGTQNIYVSNSNSDPKDYGFEDIKILGRNYYGPLNVQDNTREVTISYTNVDYQGPQMTHNVNGITKYLGKTNIYIAQVLSGSNVNQEVAEARDVIMDGDITINHTSNSDSMFWLGLSGGSQNSFTVKENSNVSIISSGNGMFYRDGTNAITMDIEKNAKVKISTNNGLFRNNPGKYLHVAEGADVEFTKNGGGQPVLWLNEDVSVAKGARLSMKGTAGSGNFAQFTNGYSGTHLNFEDPLSVLLYNKTTQQMFTWGGTANTGKMHINASIVNYWRVAGTGDRDDLPLFHWSMPDGSNVLTDLTTNGSTNTTINSTNAGMTATDFNMGTGKVISLGRIDVTLNPITDDQSSVTGTATKGSKIYIDYTESGVKTTLTGLADENGNYEIAIPKGFIKPYISVTATANLDFKTKVSSPVVVEDVTPPTGDPVIQVLEQNGTFPTDISGFVTNIKDKSDGTTGEGVTVTEGTVPKPDLSVFGPNLPMYEVVLTDKAGNKTIVKVPIFVKDADTVTSKTTAIRGYDVTIRYPDYPTSDADLKTLILNESKTQAWDLATGVEVKDLSGLSIDISKMKPEVGQYDVTLTLGDVSKTIKVNVIPGELELLNATANLDFGTHKVTAKEETYSAQQDLNLEVSDTRGSKAVPWEVQLKVTSPLQTSAIPDATALNNALWIKKGTDQRQLNSEFQSVYTNQGTNGNEQKTITWATKDQDGLIIKLQPGQIQASSYSATVEWLVSDAP